MTRRRGDERLRCLTAAETEIRFRVLEETETRFCFHVLITMAAVGVTTAAETETRFRVLAETETRLCFLPSRWLPCHDLAPV